ncbi:hypothetical protein ABZP36_000304 [Zizania latifolia]
MILSARISKVVERLRLYLGNSSDSFKNTTKKLDVLEDKLPFLHPDSLQLLKPDKEEAAAAWLRRLEKATHDAEGLLEDMESEVKAHNSSDYSVTTWLSSDNGNTIRMIYIISKLASVYSEGESIVDTPCLNGSASEDKISLSSVAMTIQNKSLLHDDFLIGRDEEIAMIRDMVLDNAHYVAEPTSHEFRKEADRPNISQKGWITETLQKIDLSERTQQATEVSPYLKNEMGNKVGYNSTDTYLRNPAVIPIVGVSGVGKSALAQFIFNDRNVREYFGDRSAWVYMTDKINQLDVIKKIIHYFDPKYDLSGVINLESAHIGLHRVIVGKRFLLVLDDVWDDVIWSCLRSVLSEGAPGSVVLVTTQLYSVADSVGTAGPIILDPLQTDDSWTLLKRFAFVEPCQSLSTESLEEIGKKITHRLPGLPLAVKVIGATLRSKLGGVHWSSVLNSWWWNIADDSLATRVISSLGSCYSELPGYLRQCFVYCSIFPRSCVYEKDKLVQMWIANGFIQLDSSTGAKRLEDVAGEWFHELVNRAFLQPSTCKTGYIMHDLVWDFANALSSNEYHGIDSSLRGVSHHVRYLSIDMEGLNALLKYINIKQLRTILLFGDNNQPSSNEIYRPLGRILDGSTNLRLLDLSSCGLGIVIPNDMSALKHLRYLDLSFTGIKRVPDSVCSLCLLQVLGLRGCTLDELPGNMNSLINLRHLLASSDTIAKINGIGKLTKLQELHGYHVQAEDGHRISELSDMNDLRGSLCISGLEMVTNPSEAVEANIVGKKYLTTLELRWSAYYFVEDITPPDLTMAILEGLSPPTYLQDLKLYGYSGFAFPEWLSQLKHVRTVGISSCKNLNVLPPLGQLEHLQKLKLNELPSIKDIGSEFYGTSNVVFRSLEELSFEDMESWESWMYAGSSEFIPNLQKLRISYCHRLSKVPFESLSSSTKERLLSYHVSSHGDSVSRYLQRQTGLTHLELEVHGKLIIPCKQLKSLVYLRIQGFDEVCIKGGLWCLRNLKDLRILDCRAAVTELDEELEMKTSRVMHSLTHLTLDGISLRMYTNIIPQTPSLRYLHLDRVWDLTSTFEQWLQQLTSLQELELSSRILPSSLASLSSLKRFTLQCSYPPIRSIPPNSLPGNLKELQIEGCSSELEAGCQNPKVQKMEEWRKKKTEQWLYSWMREKVDQALIGQGSLVKERDEWLKEQERKLHKILGKDWPNISHVPYIRVNGQIVQNLYT